MLCRSLIKAQDLEKEIGRAACLCQAWVCRAKTEGLHAETSRAARLRSWRAEHNSANMTSGKEHACVLEERRQETYCKANRQLRCQSFAARLQTLTCVSLSGLLVCSMVLRFMLAPLLSTKVMVRFTGWIPLRGIVW